MMGLVKLLLLITVQVLVIGQPSYAQQVCKGLFLKSKSSPTLEQLRDHLMAVHVTDHYPTEGVLKSAMNRSFGIRPTVHFALGEMVVTHGLGNWENKSFAILVPFKDLEPQLLNVFHQDTFILGHFHLTPGTILIAKEGLEFPKIKGVKILRFDPNQISLREKIKEVLRLKNQWVFQASGSNGGVTFENEELDPFNFFKTLFEKYPHVTFGLHYGHSTGKIDHIMANNFRAIKGGRPVNRNYLGWTLLLAEVQHYLNEIDQLLTQDAFKNKIQIVADYRLARQRFEPKIHIFKAEIFLQKSHGKTLLGSSSLSKEFTERLFEIAEDPKLLRNYLLSNLSEFTKASQSLKIEDDIDSFSDLMILRDVLNLNELIELIKSEPQLTQLGAGSLEQQIYLKKIDDLKRLNLTSKRLKALESYFTTSLESCGHSLCNLFMERLLTPKFIEIKKTVLTKPSVILNLQNYYDVTVFMRIKSGDVRPWLRFAHEMNSVDESQKDKFWTRGLSLDRYELAEGHRIAD